MKQLIAFTIREILLSRAFRLMLLSPLFLMLGSFIFTDLFMLDLSKVFTDTVFASAHLLFFTFLMFLAAPFFARDIDTRFTYILLTLPISRNQYILARFMGVSLALILLATSLFISAAIAMQVVSSMWGSHVTVNNTEAIMLGIGLISLQYISLIAIAIFIFSWATGSAEILSFTFLICLLAWVFPPILTAMQDPELAEGISPLLLNFLEICYQLLPHLTGGEIATHLAHHLPIPSKDILYYTIEHLTYTVVLVLLACLFFRNRDL